MFLSFHINPLFRPAWRDLIWDAQVIEYAGDDGVGDWPPCGAGIEAGLPAKWSPASSNNSMFRICTKLKGVPEAPESIFAFLQHHVGGAQEHILAVAVRDAAKVPMCRE